MEGGGEGGVIAGYGSLIYLCGVLAGLAALQEIFCINFIENQTKICILDHDLHLVGFSQFIIVTLKLHSNLKRLTV